MTIEPNIAHSQRLRVMMSEPAIERLGDEVRHLLRAVPHELVAPRADAQPHIAFVSRDVTGLSTKHQVLPGTQRFYDALLEARHLRWVHTHSAGTDRPVFAELRRRGVDVTGSAGANAAVVAQTALAGILALARRLPQLMAAQRRHEWAPLIGGSLPPDLAGQTAAVVGWGAIGQGIARHLAMLEMRVVAVRSSATPCEGAAETVAYEGIDAVLPRTDWLVLACPLTERTQHLVDRTRLGLLPDSAYLVNVARGEVVEEDALIEALRASRIAGAFLDVFAHEPLQAGSALWDLPQVIATPHSAGFSSGNAARVDAIFLRQLADRIAGPTQGVAA
ncbi:D-2-hydroxyacid dehydrogenase [Variovorax sp. RA8]|uniref:D-2-hydroxyacid dehydrogenase n=1 Tax=Variovorax sp. (strain JCM 16519 / RA8) TaxID=662548 RepID=UPI00131994AC|nr:D-2-hydroxyacid dehydrogenase [Variovorax sp. RA8]VTU42574.1 Glyoxylate/hydroxypyruvate reductase B [Variovorax sp. RA8]